MSEAMDPQLEWLRDLVNLAFDPGEERDRALLDLLHQVTRLQPDDPEWAKYKLGLVEKRALERVTASLTSAAEDLRHLRGVVSEITGNAARDLKGTIQNATSETKQLLEDTQARLKDAIAGDAILKAYSEETQLRFGAVIEAIMKKNLTSASELVQGRMEKWVTEQVDASVARAEKSLASVTRDFQVRLYGQWGRLLWGVGLGGVVAGFILLFIGYFIGKHF